MSSSYEEELNLFMQLLHIGLQLFLNVQLVNRHTLLNVRDSYSPHSEHLTKISSDPFISPLRNLST